MNLMYAQMGLSALEGLAGYASAKIQASTAEAVKGYQNTMSALSAAQSLNTINLNEIAQRDASVRASEQLQIAAMQQEGSNAVSAAAAGVAGNTVDTVARQLRSSAARANHARLVTLRDQYRVAGQERRNTLIAKEYNKDVSVIPKPSPVSAILGVGASMLDIWDSHQTPGDTISSRLSRL